MAVVAAAAAVAAVVLAVSFARYGRAVVFVKTKVVDRLLVSPCL
jgi:hypothetical protein